MMLRADVWQCQCFRTFTTLSSLSINNNNNIIPSSSLSLPISSQFLNLNLKLNKHNIPFISCNSKQPYGGGGGGDGGGSSGGDLSGPQQPFLLASLLVSDTVKHHKLRKQGFADEVKEVKPQFVNMNMNINSNISLSILRRFRNPTIFLKVSCEDHFFLLPIVVGDYAIDTLIHSLKEEEEEDDDDDDEDHLSHSHSDCFQFLRNLVIQFGYEIKMVKITERVANTYFARVYFGKEGKREMFSVDARPSDALNVAIRCKAPIYVNKQIVQTDAIKIAYGTGRLHDSKPGYDVLLDSPMEGPDLLVEELNLVQNMKLAVKEERYNDAAAWRDKLVKLRNSGI